MLPKKSPLGDRNRSGQWGLTHLLFIYLIVSSIYWSKKRRTDAQGYKIELLYYLTGKKELESELKDSCMYGNPLFRYWWTVAQKGRQGFGVKLSWKRNILFYIGVDKINTLLIVLKKAIASAVLSFFIQVR